MTDKHAPIDVLYIREMLEKLLETPSPSGYTDAAVHLVVDELARLEVPVEVTRRGSIRATIEGARRKPARAISAHIDTLGAQVKMLKDNGRIELVAIGHWSARFAEGARVTLFTDETFYRGTILPLKASGHTFNEEIDTQPVGWPHVELRIDQMVDNRTDLEKLGINIGDIVAIDPQPEFMDNGFIVSRHLDNKAGVATVFAVIKALKEIAKAPPVDIHFLFTISEEVGSGASSGLHGDIASLIAVDNGTTAPGQNSRETGVTIGMADSIGPFDWHLTQKLLKLCREYDIPHQRDVFRYYRCDAASAIEAGNDLRTALVTFGIDASHGYERIHISALEACARLLYAYTTSKVRIGRDKEAIGPITGFPDTVETEG